MTWQDDIEQEYRHWHNAKIVTVSTSGSIDTEPTQDEISWNDSGTTKGGAITKDLASVRGTFGGISLVGDERVWVIPNVLLVNLCEIVPGYVINEDAIADLSEDTVKWTVKQAQQVNLDTQWMTLCVKQN
jgi:hypothetical protein